MLTRILAMQLRPEAQILHSKETPDLELAKVSPKPQSEEPPSGLQEDYQGQSNYSFCAWYNQSNC